jgi:RNAse (barnase) inhibitor barstar
MGKLLQRLQDASRSGVYRTAGEHEIVDALRGSDLRLTRIDLTNVADKQALLERIARALAFPHWFGANWDALEDCLGDLAWLNANGNVLVFQNAEHLPADERGVLVDVLASSAEFWAERGKSFFAVFIDPRGALLLPDLFRAS